jgi:hypothetical protein
MLAKGSTLVVEAAPWACAAGHRLGPGRVLVGWLGCTCAGGYGHRTWLCRECGHVTYDPLHVDHAQSAGRERGR